MEEEKEEEKAGERRGGTEGAKQKRMGREETAKNFNIEKNAKPRVFRSGPSSP